MRCSICGELLKGCSCSHCGFDLSQCREQYPTMMDDGKQPEAIWVALRRRSAAGQTPRQKAQSGLSPVPAAAQASGKKPLWLIPLAAALLVVGLFIGLRNGFSGSRSTSNSGGNILDGYIDNDGNVFYPGSTDSTGSPNTTESPATIGSRLSESESPSETQPVNETVNQKSVYAAYYELCVNDREKYGEASFPVTGWWRYMHGLCLARCIDFDCDGTEEMLLCYATSDDPVSKEDYVCEVWGYEDHQAVLLLQISEFNTYFTWNGSWPIWVSIGSYNGRYCLMTTEDMENQSIFLLENGAFLRKDLEIKYQGEIMLGADLDQYERTYALNGQDVENDDSELRSFLDCFDEPFIIYEIKDGTGSVITSIGGDDLIKFTNDNIEEMRVRSQ